MTRTGAFRGMLVGAILALPPAGSLAAGAGVTVDEAWTRPLPAVTTSSELYMVVRNRGDHGDRLVGARSPACGMAELFEWYASPQGAMLMRKVTAIDVPAGASVQLKPGGLHVMCTERKGTYRPGSTLPVTLSFERAGEVPVVVTVRDSRPAGAAPTR